MGGKVGHDAEVELAERHPVPLAHVQVAAQDDAVRRHPRDARRKQRLAGERCGDALPGRVEEGKRGGTGRGLGGLVHERRGGGKRVFGAGGAEEQRAGEEDGGTIHGFSFPARRRAARASHSLAYLMKVLKATVRAMTRPAMPSRNPRLKK